MEGKASREVVLGPSRAKRLVWAASCVAIASVQALMSTAFAAGWLDGNTTMPAYSRWILTATFGFFALILVAAAVAMCLIRHEMRLTLSAAGVDIRKSRWRLYVPWENVLSIEVVKWNIPWIVLHCTEEQPGTIGAVKWLTSGKFTASDIPLQIFGMNRDELASLLRTYKEAHDRATRADET